VGAERSKLKPLRKLIFRRLHHQTLWTGVLLCAWGAPQLTDLPAPPPPIPGGESRRGIGGRYRLDPTEVGDCLSANAGALADASLDVMARSERILNIARLRCRVGPMPKGVTRLVPSSSNWGAPPTRSCCISTRLWPRRSAGLSRSVQKPRGRLGSPTNIREAGDDGRASLVAAADEHALASFPCFAL
jgi:hypothetical protein